MGRNVGALSQLSDLFTFDPYLRKSVTPLNEIVNPNHVTATELSLKAMQPLLSNTLSAFCIMMWSVEPGITKENAKPHRLLLTNA
jgi:hypothetical protein